MGARLLEAGHPQKRAVLRGMDKILLFDHNQDTVRDEGAGPQGGAGPFAPLGAGALYTVHIPADLMAGNLDNAEAEAGSCPLEGGTAHEEAGSSGSGDTPGTLAGADLVHLGVGPRSPDIDWGTHTHLVGSLGLGAGMAHLGCNTRDGAEEEGHVADEGRGREEVVLGAEAQLEPSGAGLSEGSQESLLTLASGTSFFVAARGHSRASVAAWGSAKGSPPREAHFGSWAGLLGAWPHCGAGPETTRAEGRCLEWVRTPWLEDHTDLQHKEMPLEEGNC